MFNRNESSNRHKIGDRWIVSQIPSRSEQMLIPFPNKTLSSNIVLLRLASCFPMYLHLGVWDPKLMGRSLRLVRCHFFMDHVKPSFIY